MKYSQSAEVVKTEYDLNNPEEKKAIKDFYQKKRALDELKDKRAYAEQKDEESFDALIEGREELIKSMKP